MKRSIATTSWELKRDRGSVKVDKHALEADQDAANELRWVARVGPRHKAQ